MAKKNNLCAKIRKYGKEIARKQNRILDQQCLTQMLSANLLFKHSILDDQKTKMVSVIGDGYGFMTALLFHARNGHGSYKNIF